MSSHKIISNISKFDYITNKCPLAKCVLTPLVLNTSTIARYFISKSYFIFANKKSTNRIDIINLIDYENTAIYINIEEVNFNIRKIISDQKEIHILSQQGKLYTYGIYNINKNKNTFALNNYFINIFLIDICLNEKIVLCAGENKKVYIWGYINNSYSSFPTQIDLNISYIITQISIGEKYAAFLLLDRNILYIEIDKLIKYNHNANKYMQFISTNEQINNVFSGRYNIILAKLEKSKIFIMKEKGLFEINLSQCFTNFYFGSIIKIVDNDIFIECFNAKKEKHIIEISSINGTIILYKLKNADNIHLFYSDYYIKTICYLQGSENKKRVEWNLIYEKKIPLNCNIKNNKKEKLSIDKFLNKMGIDYALNKNIKNISKRNINFNLNDIELKIPRAKSVLNMRVKKTPHSIKNINLELSNNYSGYRSSSIKNIHKNLLNINSSCEVLNSSKFIGYKAFNYCDSIKSSYKSQKYNTSLILNLISKKINKLKQRSWKKEKSTSSTINDSNRHYSYTTKKELLFHSGFDRMVNIYNSGMESNRSKEIKNNSSILSYLISKRDGIKKTGLFPQFLISS